MPEGRNFFGALVSATRGGMLGAGIGLAGLGAWTVATEFVALPIPVDEAFPRFINAVTAVTGTAGFAAGFLVAVHQKARR